MMPVENSRARVLFLSLVRWQNQNDWSGCLSRWGSSVAEENSLLREKKKKKKFSGPSEVAAIDERGRSLSKSVTMFPRVGIFNGPQTCR